jgi:hypothetical protein
MMKGEKTVEFRANPVTVCVSAETLNCPLVGRSDVSAETCARPSSAIPSTASTFLAFMTASSDFR